MFVVYWPWIVFFSSLFSDTRNSDLRYPKMMGWSVLGSKLLRSKLAQQWNSHFLGGWSRKYHGLSLWQKNVVSRSKNPEGDGSGCGLLQPEIPTPKTKPETLQEWEKLTDSLGSGCSGCSIHGALQSFLRFLNGHWWCHWWCALRNLACEAPRDQGGVGCHIQSICHALSETNAGHRQEDITWWAGRSWQVSWLPSSGESYAPVERKRCKHAIRREVNAMNSERVNSDAMSSDCPGHGSKNKSGANSNGWLLESRPAIYSQPEFAG